MGKDAYYFSHDSNARHDPKILALRSVYGCEGYGWYWIIVEMLREQEDYCIKINKYTWNALAMQMQCNADAAKKFVMDCINEFELFETDGDYFWSESLLRRMEKKDAKSRKARKAAMARWNKEKGNDDEDDADAMQGHSECNAKESKGKESKGKESKQNNNTNQNQEGPDDSSDESKPIETLDYEPESKPYQAAKFLKEKILENNPRERVPDEPEGIQDWATEMDRLNRIGVPGADPNKDLGYSWKEIFWFIRWCQDNKFWKTNIKSASKFRKQITKLEDQARQQFEKQKANSSINKIQEDLNEINNDDCGDIL